MTPPQIEQTDRTVQVGTAIAIAGWFAVGGSLLRSLLAADGLGAIPRELLLFSGFFTYWTNIAVALTVTLPLVASNSRPGRFVRRPGVVTGVAASISLVALVYELLLRSGWGPLGADLLFNLLLHYLIPVAFVGYWWLVTPKPALSWRGPLVWLSYPAGYTAFVLVRGELADTYPYPFLDVAEYGYSSVLVNVAGIGLFFLVLAFLLVGVGRLADR
jgi:hypothetical protein